jgi:hypothetical protein
MSAAFALQPSGPPAPCGYPKCTLDAWHHGDHQFEKPKADNRLEFPGPRYGTCVICRVGFKVLGDYAHPMPRICDASECALVLMRREAVPFPILCPCGQRPYPHELSIHKLLRRESYNPNLNFRYPWSLCLSERREMSAEHE